MGVVLTVRTDEALREALRRRAAAQGKTVSELVREILESAVQERTIAQRAGHLRGSFGPPDGEEGPRRRQLRERNWRS
jgi:hypothetical protein